MDEVEQLRLDIIARKQRQQERKERLAGASGALGATPGTKPQKKRSKRSTASGTSKKQAPAPADVSTVDLNDTFLTYEEWKKEGFMVKKGSKATEFGMDGVAWFSLDQVQKTTPKQQRFLSWRSKR